MDELREWGNQLETSKEKSVRSQAYEGILCSIQVPNSSDAEKSLGCQLVAKYGSMFPHHEMVTIDALLELGKFGDEKHSQSVRIHAILGLVTYVKSQSTIPFPIHEKLSGFIASTMPRETSGVIVRHLTSLQKLIGLTTNPAVAASVAVPKKEAPRSPVSYDRSRSYDRPVSYERPVSNDRENKRESIPPSPYLFVKGFPQGTELERLINYFQPIYPTINRQLIHIHNPKITNAHNAFLNCGSIDKAREIMSYASTHPFNGRIMIILFARGPVNNSVVFHLASSFPTTWSNYEDIWNELESELRSRRLEGSFTVKEPGKVTFESLETAKSIVPQILHIQGEKIWVVYDYEEQSKPKIHIPHFLQASNGYSSPTRNSERGQQHYTSSVHSSPLHHSESGSRRDHASDRGYKGGNSSPVSKKYHHSSSSYKKRYQSDDDRRQSPRHDGKEQSHSKWRDTDRKSRDSYSDDTRGKPAEEYSRQTTLNPTSTLRELAREANTGSSRRDDTRSERGRSRERHQSRERHVPVTERRTSLGDVARAGGSEKYVDEKYKRRDDSRGRDDVNSDRQFDGRTRSRHQDDYAEQENRFTSDRRSTYRSDPSPTSRSGRSRSRTRADSRERLKPMSLGEIARAGGSENLELDQRKASRHYDERRSPDRPSKASLPSRSLGDIARAGGGSLKQHPERTQSRDYDKQGRDRSRSWDRGQDKSHKDRSRSRERDQEKTRNQRDEDSRSAPTTRFVSRHRDDDSRDQEFSNRDDRRGTRGRENDDDDRYNDSRNRDDDGSRRDTVIRRRDSRDDSRERNVKPRSDHHDTSSRSRDDDSYRSRDHDTKNEYQQREYSKSTRDRSSSRHRGNDSSYRESSRHKDDDDRDNGSWGRGDKDSNWKSSGNDGTSSRGQSLAEMARSTKRKDYGGRDNDNDREDFNSQRRRQEPDRSDNDRRSSPGADFYSGRPQVDYSGAIFRDSNESDRRKQRSHTPPQSKGSGNENRSKDVRQQVRSPEGDGSLHSLKMRDILNTPRQETAEINELDVDYEDDD